MGFSTLTKLINCRLILLVLLVSCSHLVAQTTVSMTPVKDNTLYENPTGAVSNGAGMHLFAGANRNDAIRRGLICFDIAGNVPSGATIETVTLTLNVSNVPPPGGAHEFSLHRVTAEWGQGTSDAPASEGSGTVATTDDATWVHRLFDRETWAQPGGDFVSTASASVTIGPRGLYIWASTSAIVADVQRWLDNDVENYGWLLKGDELSSSSARRFDSLENSTEANRPTLSVTYLTVTSVEAGHLGGPNEFTLAQNWPTPFNPTTHVQYSIPARSHVNLQVFNLHGRLIATLVNWAEGAGEHSARWNGLDAQNRKVATGVYVYRLAVGNSVAVKKMTLLK